MYDHHLYSPTPDYGVRPTFIRAVDVNKRSGFSSLYAVSKDTAEALQSEGTTQGFKGVVWSERLWVDVDSYEAADATESKLIALGLDYIAYDSGGRGAHFGILREAKPSHLLPYKDKQYVETQFPEADLSIYTHLHPFRLPNTTHQKTGRTKQLVAQRGGSVLTLPPFERRSLPPSKRVENTARRCDSIFDNFRVLANTIPVANGQRHPTLIRLLYALRDADIPSEHALWWVLEVNKMCSEPKEEHEIEKAFLSIFR